MKCNKIIFHLAATLTLLGPAISYWWTEKTEVAWLALVAAATFTFFTRLDDLAELSLGPIRAKMREAIAEAVATLDQLRELATALSGAVLTDLMAGNFMDGMKLATRLNLHDQVIASLEKIGVSNAQKASAEEEWRKGISITYHRAIKKAIEEDRNLEGAAAIANEFQNTLRFEHWSALSPDEVDEFLHEKGVTSREARAWVDDYRHFVRTNEIRNRERFALA